MGNLSWEYGRVHISGVHVRMHTQKRRSVNKFSSLILDTKWLTAVNDHFS